MSDLRFEALDVWPYPEGKILASPFRTSWSQTNELLRNELDAIKARDAVLRVVTLPGNCRLDGFLRADAKVNHRGAVVGFTHPKAGRLTYPCATFEHWSSREADWQHNVRAIALALEALRKVDRYGVTAGSEQYLGFRAIGSGSIELAHSPMTVERAVLKISELAGWTIPADPADPSVVETAYKAAAKRCHPDVGGSAEDFKTLNEAIELYRSRP